MTTVISGGDELLEPVTSPGQIVEHIERHAKPPDGLLFGVEYERLGVDAATGRAMPFDGGVERVLEIVAERDGWEKGLENGRIVYLKKGLEAITLEPGGQTEYSSAPFSTIAELMERERAVNGLLDAAAAELGFAFLGIGYHPFADPAEIGWVPKERYRMMAPYLASRGSLAHEMMKMTAGCQVALDYTDGRDAMRKLRAAALATPIAQALFASSGIGRGRALPVLDWRAHIWTRTDDARCNIPPFMLRAGAALEEYVDWLVDMPLIFLEKDGVYRASEGKTLRALMERGPVTYYDVELAMTQAFPEVRLKRFIEVRSLDAPQPWLVGTVPCFWSSLLYGDVEAVFDLLGPLTPDEFAELRTSAIRDGLQGSACGRPMADWARDLLDAAQAGCICERSFHRLRERIERKETPADLARRLLAEESSPAGFIGRWNRYGADPLFC